MKRSPIALLMFVLLSTAIGVRAQETPLPEAYTGVALGTGGIVGGKSIHFDFRITPYTTDEDVQKFAQLVKDQGTDGLRRALEKEVKGRLAVVGSAGNQIAIAREAQAPLSPSLLPATCLSSSSITTDGQPIIRSVLQVKLDAQGTGNGQIMAAAKIRFDEKKDEYQIESFGNQFIKAVNVRPNK